MCDAHVPAADKGTHPLRGEPTTGHAVHFALISAQCRGPPDKTTTWQSNMTALWREAALFSPGYERHSPVAPNDFDRLMSGYRLI